MECFLGRGIRKKAGAKGVTKARKHYRSRNVVAWFLRCHEARSRLPDHALPSRFRLTLDIALRIPPLRDILPTSPPLFCG